jgi:hypothetical protein
MVQDNPGTPAVGQASSLSFLRAHGPAFRHQQTPHNGIFVRPTLERASQDSALTTVFVQRRPQAANTQLLSLFSRTATAVRKNSPFITLLPGSFRLPQKLSFYHCFSRTATAVRKNSPFITLLPESFRLPQKLSLYHCFSRTATAVRKNSPFITLLPGSFRLPQKLSLHHCFARIVPAFAKLSFYQCFVEPGPAPGYARTASKLLNCGWSRDLSPQNDLLGVN